MLSEVVEFSPAILVIVPIVIGLVQVLKEYVGPRFTPLLAIVLSVGGAFLATDLSWQMTIVQGFGVAVLAVGTYSGLRSTIQG